MGGSTKPGLGLFALLAIACGPAPPPPAHGATTTDVPVVGTEDGHANREGETGETATVYGMIGLLPQSEPSEPSSPRNKTRGSPLPIPVVAQPSVTEVSRGPAPAALAKALFAMDQKRYSEALKGVESVLGSAVGQDALDLRLQALALRGRIHERANDIKKADASYGAVIAARADAEVWAARQVALGAAERASFVTDALGEALFVAAERKRSEAGAIVRPSAPAGDREVVLRFVNTKLKQWVGEKRAAVEETDLAYQAIASIQPAPPAGWVVAGSARAAGTWTEFIRDFRDAPLPDEWKGDGAVAGTDITRAELRAAYTQALVDATEPQLERARSTFRFCDAQADKAGISDAFSRACDEWLKLDGQPR